MASPNVSFTSIPNNIRKPGKYFEQNVSNALNGLTPLNDKVCLLAVELDSGSVAPMVPTKIFSDADAQLYFGAGSVAHLTAREMLYTNPYINLTVMGISDGDGSKSVGTISIVDATATQAGVLDVWIGDQHVQATYAAGDTSSTISAAVYSQLALISNYLPVTDATSAGVITLTARNKGTIGNKIALSAKVSGGLTAPTVVQMTGGTAEPDLGNYLTPGDPLNAVVSGGYTMFVNAVSDSTSSGNWTKLKAMVDFVSGPLEQRPAIIVGAMTDENDTMANVETFCGTTLNHGRTTIAYVNYESDNLAKSEFFKIAGAYAAEIASESDPARPLNGLVLAGISTPSVIDRLTRTQQEACLNAGTTPLEVASDDELSIVRAISTYTTTGGVPDPTLLDITTIRTLDYVRAQVRTRLTLRFPRNKLSTRTPNLVKSQVLDVLYLLQGLEIVQNVDTYKAGIVVEVDSSDNTRLNVKIPTNIVSGLHVIAGVIDLIL